MSLPSLEQAKNEVSRLLTQPTELQALLERTSQQLSPGTLNRTLSSLPPEVLSQARSLAASTGLNPRDRNLRRLAADPSIRSLASGLHTKRPSGGLLAIVIYSNRRTKLIRATEESVGTIIGVPIASALTLDSDLTAWFDPHHRGDNRRARRLLGRAVGGTVVLTANRDLSLALLTDLEKRL